MRFEGKQVEDCFDGSLIYEYQLEEVITHDFIRAMGKALGRLEYFADFPRPFFRILTQAGLQVKGCQGEYTFIVIFPARERPRREEFETWLTELEQVCKE